MKERVVCVVCVLIPSLMDASQSTTFGVLLYLGAPAGVTQEEEGQLTGGGGVIFFCSTLFFLFPSAVVLFVAFIFIARSRVQTRPLPSSTLFVANSIS